MDELYHWIAVDVIREQRERERLATLIASVANIAGAKPKVSVDKLLGRKPKAEKPKPGAPRQTLASILPMSSTTKADASKIAAARESARKAK